MSTSRWTDAQWRAGALEWVDKRLSERGMQRTGEVAQPHIYPWSTALRIPTTDGVVWFKAAARGGAYEVALLEVLARVVPEDVLPPLALDPHRGWSLLPDGGTTLRSWLDGRGPDKRIKAWESVFPMYADLQRRTVPALDELLAAGVPDLRPSAVPAAVQQLVAIDDVPAELRERLVVLQPLIVDACLRLAADGLPATLQHDDLHENNVLLVDGSPGHYRIFDFGDASIAHPLGTWLVTSRSLTYHAGWAPDGPELARLRDVYLEAFSDLAPLGTLRESLRIAYDVASIGRVLSWQRALLDATPEEAAPWRDNVVGWIEELVDGWAA